MPPIKKNTEEVIGLLPAAGKATRLGLLPCSKELYPVSLEAIDETPILRPKVICQYLLERMRLANITNVYIILRKGKWDIPNFCESGSFLNMHLAYLIMDLPYGVPYTVDQAFPFLGDAKVAFGFPDIIFEPNETFSQILERQTESNADLVLGLFPARDPHEVDMVDLGTDGQIKGIKIKPEQTRLQYTWIVAVWTPVFTRFMHEYILSDQRNREKDFAGTTTTKELFIGEIIDSAIRNDVRIDKVLFDDGYYLDIGTPRGLVEAVKVFNR